MSQPLVSPSLLFRYSVPCRHLSAPWPTDETQLPKKYAIPTFSELDDGRPLFADLRLGWHETGIGVSVRVQGKKQQPWCRASRIEDSDGLSLFIDTRDTQDIHRASRFCHRFVLLPAGTGRKYEQPAARLVPINRSREDPKQIGDDAIKIRGEDRIDGYLLRAFIPAEAITGYETAEHCRLGFSYVAIDRELGWQTFSVGNELPFTSDPSLWGTLELVQ